ncbi:MAG: SpoIIE family protein phosphatase [Lachnospiraceae bacterium]|nr:SpoIIE family protein phosphatase [Lachnospiraceae bacterium]
MSNRGSLGKKIFIGLMSVAMLTLILILAISTWRLFRLRDTLNRSLEASKNTTIRMSSLATKQQALENLRASADASADLCDEVFKQFKRSVETLAETAEQLYGDEEAYSYVSIARPDASNAGELTVQLLYSEKVDENDPAIQKEVGLLGNMQGTLLSVHKGYEPIVADCVATKSGIMMMADLISEAKFDENGNYLPYEADTRPWYKGVMETGETYFTPLSRDAHTEKVGIMCGAPVRKDNEIVAVAEAGMYLDELEDAVIKAAENQMEGTVICIVDRNGELVVSTAESGVFAIDFNNIYDLRTSENTEIALFIMQSLFGQKIVRDLKIDDEEYYAVSAPLQVVGWTYIILVPEKQVLSSTDNLASQLRDLNEEANQAAIANIRRMLTINMIAAVFVIVFTFVVARIVSNKLVTNIKGLTAKVKSIEGDNLDFKWENDTNDEIQTLAETFEAMTKRMQNYIDEVKTITAEKERIGAELNVATKIQADMLPSIFPAFPDRKDIDLYASMDPAKEVGGDFYDFFLVDDNHLALVMADVSGKGVPAALFMVIAKTLIKNHLQSEETVDMTLTLSNNQLAENNEEMLFVTAWISIVDLRTGEVHFADAGHETALVLHRDGTVDEIKPKKKRVPLAAMEGISYIEDTFNLGEGDTLFLYTDGVPEATDVNEELYGMDRLKSILKKNAVSSPEEILKSVRLDVDEFVGEAPQFDDLTMLAYRRK